MKKIAILLPGPRREPVGGYKVLYQYGDYLALNGWDVDYIYLTNSIVCNSRFYGLKGKLKSIVFSNTHFYKWFDFRSLRSNHYIEKDLNQRLINSYHLIICSSVETFIYIKEDTDVRSDKLIYFVQGYENWNVDKETLDGTFTHQNLDYITVSDDLAKKISNIGGRVSLILHNGIDKDSFFSFIKWESRKKSSFLFLYHPAKHKGCDLLLHAVSKIRNENNLVNFSCFSAYPKPKKFPKYITYHYQPSLIQLNELYNNHKFFICSSIHEGFGLTPAEAAFAGEIILTTKNGGVEQYIKNGITGYLIDEISSDAFSNAIRQVLSKEESLATFSRKSSLLIKQQLDLHDNFIRFNDFLNNKLLDKK